MRLLAPALLAVPAVFAGQPDASEIIERSIAAHAGNWKIARNYTFVERSERRQFNSDGSVRSRRVLTYDITLLEGSPYRRLIGQDDRPLSAEEERKQQEKLRKSIEERRREDESARARRMAAGAQRREREIEAIRDLPKAFEFRLAGEETLAGVETWVLDATPRAGYRPRNRRTRFFPKLRGRLWAAKADCSWVKVEAEVIDTISFGLLLARLGQGSWLRFEQVRVNDEVWLPARIAVSASARVALLKKYNLEQEITYQRYRKFQSESRIVSTSEIAE